MKINSLLLAASSLLSSTVWALPGDTSLKERDASNRLVFAHFMVGVVGNRKSAADYDDDMKRAKALGIDAFALNAGNDDYTNDQLNYAYESAANNDMKVFISFDFNSWGTDQASAIGQKVADYAGKPGQLIVDNKPFVSTFVGDGLDVAALRSAAGQEIYFAPNFQSSTDVSNVDALFNWMAWPSNGNNKAPTDGNTVTVPDGDNAYTSALGGKDYVAPASPWFFTHFGAEVSYSKNFVFPSDTLWYDRWNQILELGPRFVEIITWNDYGESHYIGPLSSMHTDDGNSKWANDMPHGGWLDLAKPYIAAFKAGATSVGEHITDDELIYWYRPNPRDTDCDATDTCMADANNDSGNYFKGRPNGWESMEDSVFVVSLLTSPATVQVTSGGNTKSFEAPAGAASFKVDMGVGKQQFSVVRDGNEVLSGTSQKDIIDGCVCGLYNFNAFVGTLPAGDADALQPEALASFTDGLKVDTCQATPSLGASAPAATA
ncbi:glycoside hydrolase family 71 protein [Aspergillus melleus]|uniref:glycoside hydrolase family 71 protein n=1 Tax=Aspergillus melleus TaxID=138277 RepID=UPI001E8EDB29|nr:uncharacterized protein LDX57_005252 [Aspergillus melleus]KAH8427539.1 hypothetical protein LDX57_005252 [Aspergillus melleus]